MLYIEDVIGKQLGILDKARNPNEVIGWFHEVRPLKDAKFQSEVSDTQKEEFLALTDDYLPFFFALFEYANNLPEFIKYTKKFPNRTVVMLDRLIPDLDPSNIDQMAQNYWKIKKRYSEILIDLIVNPEKPEYAIQEDGQETNIFSIFKTRIAEEAKRKEEQRESK